MPEQQRVLTPTICRQCAEVFYGPAEGLGGGAILLGEEPTQRAMRYTATLVKHLETKHPELVADAHEAGASYAGMLKLIQFDIGDPLLHEQANYLRWFVHRQSRKATAKAERVVTDQRIVERVEHLFATMLAEGTTAAVNEALTDPNLYEPNQLGDRIVQLLRLMRDVLEEVDEPRNPFQPARAEAVLAS